MWKVTYKGVLAHKVRFLLTGVAVMLGVAFVSGTLVLTSTIGHTFDNLFSNIFPLFGRQWELDPGTIQPGDSGLDRNDQLDAIGLRSLPLPQPIIDNIGRPTTR